MDTKFEKEQILKIIPVEVEKTCSSKIVSVDDNTLTIELIKTDKELELYGQCECFSATDAGIIYFKSIIEPKNKETKHYTLRIPPLYNIMQRREYTRVPFNASVLFKSEHGVIPVLVTDLSAGGMKIVSTNEIQMSQAYSFQLHLGKQMALDTTFTPIRQEKNEQNSYTISGKFKHLTNKERIALVQYCFSKQMENTNK